MRAFQVALLIAVVAFCGSLTARAQSLEETYDTTLAAYNQTLNQMEECDQAFAEFQQFFKEQRPGPNGTKEEWDTWGRSYRAWVDIFTGCLRRLKKEADDLRRKLGELERQLDGTSSASESKGGSHHREAQDLVKKGRKNLSGWTINVQYKIRNANEMSREASDRVSENGSGQVKVEPRFQFEF